MLKQIQDWFGMSSQGQSLGLGHGPDDGKGHGHTHGSFLPGITVSVTPDNYSTFSTFRLAKFDGKTWKFFGGNISTASK